MNSCASGKIKSLQRQRKHLTAIVNESGHLYGSINLEMFVILIINIILGTAQITNVSLKASELVLFPPRK